MSFSEIESKLNKLKADSEAPEWMEVQSYDKLRKGYLSENETPRNMYRRIANSAAKHLLMPELEDKFFDLMWDNILCPATPILSNSGTNRGLPISCYGVDVNDSVWDISGKVQEVSMLSKHGGGVGVGFSRIRPRGTKIQNGENGVSDGIVGFMKMYDSTINAMSQGSTRRGAGSINLDIEHGDWAEFIRMRRPEGDVNRQCGNLHHCTFIKDKWMESMLAGDFDKRQSWVELMKARMELGESYIAFYDNINKTNPDAYKTNNLDISMTNICTEITLHTDENHSFICCLSSLNLMKWEEFKARDAVKLSTYFLNGILNEFIFKARGLAGLHRVVRSAEKGRAIGLGVLGWHSLLQTKMMPFGSFETMQLNNEIFRHLKLEAVAASKELAEKFGEPTWLKGSEMYNTHLLAVAPTRSNCTISCVDSFGIEPLYSNYYIDSGSKGEYAVKNRLLEELLKSKNKNTKEVWKSIRQNKGSVQQLTFLNDQEKSVFKTAYEIDQQVIIQQAAQRQRWICQAQSLNLFFPKGVDPKYFSDTHILAWQLGVKTLYYCRSEAGIVVDEANRNEECVACEG